MGVRPTPTAPPRLDRDHVLCLADVSDLFLGECGSTELCDSSANSQVLETH